MDQVDVLRELQEALRGISPIYSDNLYWERRWPGQLDDLAVEVQDDIKTLVPARLHGKWKGFMLAQFKIHILTPHRSDHDALAISLALKALQMFD